MVKLSRTYVSEKNVLFRYELPAGKTFVSKPPSSLNVQLEGRGWELMFDYLYDPEILLTYDLTKFDQNTLTNNQLRSDIDRKLTFNSIRVAGFDQNIALQLETGATKKVPVIALDSLSFAGGYHAVRPLFLEPDSVLLEGPASLLKKIKTWETMPFQFKNLKNSTFRLVNLQSPPPEIMLSTNHVKASVEIEQITEKSMFVKLMVLNPPADSVKYFPETVKITCTVGLSNYNKIETSDFAVVIDLSTLSLKQGKHTVPIKLARQPLEALSVQFTPKSAEFFIFKR